MKVSIGNGTFHSCLHLKKSEVVGSNPTRSTFINLVEYGIELSSILVIGGQKPSNARGG